MTAALNVLSLFSGIGGFERAFQRLGVPTVASVEIDDQARGVLADHFPDTQLLTDVTKVTADDARAAGFVPERGVVTAGWPCQGNSAAGRREGMDDPRSGLWREVVRLVAETRPRWFFGENVPGLLTVRGGRDFYRVVRDLDDLGYGVAWRVLDAQFFGLAQRRQRVLVVGCLGDGAAPAQVLLEPESGARHLAARREAGEVVAALTRSSLGGGGADDNNGQAGHLIPVRDVATTITAREGKGPDSDATTTLIVFDAAKITSRENRSNPRPGDPAPSIAATGRPMIAHTLTAEGHDASEDGTGRGVPLVPVGIGLDGETSYGGDISPTVTGSHGQPPGLIDGIGVRRLTPKECERLQGYPDNWTATSWGKPQADSPRYRQLGNSVAVPVIEWVARRLIAADAALFEREAS